MAKIPRPAVFDEFHFFGHWPVTSIGYRRGASYADRYTFPRVKQFIESSQPEYYFCGHIHEAEGRQIRIGKTTAINVGKRGYLLEV